MPDYSNHREWKDVELYTEREYLSEYEEYSPEDVYKICKALVEKAQGQGLECCYLKFKSHMEPYEDWLGNPSVVACGYRRLTPEEQQEQREQDAVESLAKKLNISVYEASIVKGLRERGKL